MDFSIKKTDNFYIVTFELEPGDIQVEHYPIGTPLQINLNEEGDFRFKVTGVSNTPLDQEVPSS